ncbi:ABC transporter substrate binding protein [Xenophilus sp. Marseille-Q4582]|uniref:ABC transporter substrate binding protein n=1 Tax=Xenophilus sp. Marseille-Q4582 TaxID=2866600 RepID=UPI001CE40FBC|nr:ABC transporter substrate binding protein [Xenophilus sp. Marseille-Q4582]
MTLAVFLARGALPASLARTLLRFALQGLLLTGACAAWAVEWQLVPGPAAQAPSQAEFLRALQDLGQATPDEPAANAGVRTRGVRAAGAGRVTLALGAEAARAALARDPAEPLLLALLSRQDYDALPAAPRSAARVAVLLRDTAPAEQLKLVDALLPGRRRLGLVVTAGSETLLRELQQAAEADGRGWSLQVATAADPLALGPALREVLPRSDVLVLLPDAIGTSQAATLAVLRAAAAAGVPVIGSGEGPVRSGALAASTSSPAQLARRAHALGERLLARGGPAAPLLEWAPVAQVRINPHVARSLDLRLPSEQALTQRLAVPPGGS